MISTDPDLEYRKKLADRLGRGADRNDLLLEICEQRGLSWRQAQEYLVGVELDQPRRIGRWRGLVWLLLSILACIEGAVQAGFSGYSLYDTMIYGLRVNGSAPSPGAITWTLFHSQYLVMMLISTLTGLMILAGGIYWLVVSLRKLSGSPE